MKQILTALFVITASVATAEGEGRYLTASLDDKTVVVTDTKLGKIKLCEFAGGLTQVGGYYSCGLWRDVAM